MFIDNECYVSGHNACCGIVAVKTLCEFLLLVMVADLAKMAVWM